MSTDVLEVVSRTFESPDTLGAVSPDDKFSSPVGLTGGFGGTASLGFAKGFSVVTGGLGLGVGLGAGISATSVVDSDTGKGFGAGEGLEAGCGLMGAVCLGAVTGFSALVGTTGGGLR